MRALSRVVWTCLVVALLAAPVQAQNQAEPNVSTPTTLYFHIFDTFNRFVVNTQPMDTDYFDVGGTNNPTLEEGPWTAVTEAIPLGLGPWDLNTIYGTSTAGPVEYGFIENGKPRFHPEHGIAKTVVMDEGVTPEVTVYLDLRDIVGSDGLPSFSPAFTLELTMREGDDTSRDAKLDAGKPIMHGKQDFHLMEADVRPGASVDAVLYWSTFMAFTGLCGEDLCGPARDLEDYGLEGLKEPSGGANTVFSGGQEMPDESKVVAPDEYGIVALKVPMTIENDGTIPKSQAYNIRMDWYQLEEAFGEDVFATGYMRLFSGATPDGAIKQHHMDMNIMNPIYVEFLHPQVAAGTLLIHAGVNSPWGTYDIDGDSVELTIEGPSEPKRVKQLVNQNQHVHGLHDQAAAITYLWDFRGEEAAEGDYEICIAVKNNGVPDEFGETRPETVVQAKDCAGFTIKEKEAYGVDTQGNKVAPTFMDEEVDTPAVGILPLIALIGAALIAARRRWNA